jgi:hypothetical protein
MLLFNGLFVATMGALVLKRYRNYAKKKKKETAVQKGTPLA